MLDRVSSRAFAKAMRMFEKLREEFEIGLGCVSVAPGEVDSPPRIVERVRKALEFVAPERITLNPGAVVSMDEVYQKIQNELAAARMVSEECN